MPRKIIALIAFSILLLTSLTARCQTAATGNIFADSKALYNIIFASADPTPQQAQTGQNILNYYFNSIIANNEDFLTKARASNNSFLVNADAAITKLFNAHAIAPEAGTPSAAGSTFANFNATNILQGAAQFLVSRGEQELSMAFFTRFQTAMSKYPEFKVLFPKTSSLLNNITNSNLLTLLQQLRDAFSKDLLSMPGNILSFRDYTYTGDANIAARIKVIHDLLNNGETATLIVTTLNLVQGLINGNDIPTGLNNAVTDKPVCLNTDKLSQYLKLTNFFVQALKTNSGDNGVFINSTDLQGLFSNKDQLNLFLGLAFQQSTSNTCLKDLSITIDANTSLSLLQVLQAVQTGASTFYNGLSALQKINASIQGIKANVQKGNGVDAGNYGSLVSGVVDLLNNICNTVSSMVKDKSASASIAAFKLNLTIASDFCSDIQQKNYAGIFNDVIQFINQNKIFANNPVQGELITYLSFAANLASATSPAQVQNVLESVALPPGSYSIKQKSSFNISLNGYIGYNWDLGQGHGIYAPIGLAASIGLGKVHGGALTVFISLIDLGGIASYDVLHNDSAATLKQNITFQSVIAPGIQGFIEIPKWPLAIGGGWRMTPKLFYSGTSGVQTVKSVSTGTLTVLIDIPIFTLFNRPFK